MGSQTDFKIDILMATCNGEEFIGEQIESIINQTYGNWNLIIHDDGSSDGTLDVISGFCKRDPERIHLVQDEKIFHCAKKNFAHLMALSKSEYIMFSDQDDYWLKDKISDSLNIMLKTESAHSGGTPVCVFTDLKVVDNGLNVISDSMWKYQKTDPGLFRTLKQIAVRNCATGCTMLINRPAKRAALPVPDEAVMHDWWIALMTKKKGGVLAALEKSTVLYRQHSFNRIGARRADLKLYLAKLATAGKTFRENIKTYSQSKKAGVHGFFPFFLTDKLILTAKLIVKR